MRRHRAARLPIAMAGLFLLATGAQAEEIDLAGPWAFQLDPLDQGVDQAWFERVLADAVRLPGSLQQQGFGDEVSVDTSWTGNIVDRSWFESPRYERFRQADNVKIPFWLQPKKHYVGPAWYQRTIDLPEAWHSKRVTLHLERPHWETTVWLDGQRIGSENSLSTPHVYDLGQSIRPGTHRLTVRVDNRLKDVDVGVNSHSISDHTQSNWNGIVGRMFLETSDRVWIDDVQVFADPETRSARMEVTLGNAPAAAARGTLTLDAALDGTSPHDPPGVTYDLEFKGSRATVSLDYPLGDEVRTWDEFHPAVYRLAVRLEGDADGTAFRDETSVGFGVRRLLTVRSLIGCGSGRRGGADGLA